jgi:hypothetical protein
MQHASYLFQGLLLFGWLLAGLLEYLYSDRYGNVNLPLVGVGGVSTPAESHISNLSRVISVESHAGIEDFSRYT